MKWLNKFENGGSMEQGDNQIRKVISGLTALVKRAKNKDEEAKAQIAAILEDEQAANMLNVVRQMVPELIEEMEAIISTPMAKNGGELEYIHTLKCGGKTKKVSKKEKGDKVTTKTSYLKKGKPVCPCSLKRIGGTIIEVDCEGVPVHKIGGRVQKFEDGKTIWQKWWNKITEKPITSDRAKFGKTSIAFNNFKTTPQWNYVGDPLMQNVGTNVVARTADGYLPEDGTDWYRQMPTGTISTLTTDRRLNAQFDENNRQKEFEESLQDPSMLPGETQVMQEAMARNAEYDVQQAALKKQQQQKEQAARDQRVRAFYSKMLDADKRALQSMLKDAGYYTGEIDGLIGNGTLSALRKFQQDNKLSVDSMAGQKTFDALRAKTRQTAQPNTDPTKVPGYTQVMQLLSQMDGSANATPVKTGGPTGGMGLNDVRQGKEIPIVGPSTSLNLTPGLDMIPQRKQGGWLTKFN